VNKSPKGLNVQEDAPQREQFCHYATMFKLTEPDSGSVECVQCRHLYPLADLMTHELEEHECPNCLTTSGMFWGSKPHRVVEED